MKLLYALSGLMMACLSTLALADDSHYQISNDLSAISGSIDTKQHIYYPGDTIDVRVTIGGNTQLLADLQVDMYLGLFATAGKLMAVPISDPQASTTRKILFLQNLDSSVLTPGSYHLALIATVPGGNPANVEDWYNGFGGFLDEDAILFSETAVSRDFNGDGEWDDDYDRDGFYGDNDTVFEHYYTSEGMTYEDSKDMNWDDNGMDDYSNDAADDSTDGWDGDNDTEDSADKDSGSN